MLRDTYLTVNQNLLTHSFVFSILTKTKFFFNNFQFKNFVTNIRLKFTTFLNIHFYHQYIQIWFIKYVVLLRVNLNKKKFKSSLYQ
jgi:hypothetical protein